MEAIKMTLSEKIEQELERDLQKAMEDKDFNLLVKRLKISKDLAKKNNTSLQDTCSELKNCSNCQGLFMCKNRVSGHVLYPNVDNDSIKFIYTPCKWQKMQDKALKEKEDSLNEIKIARMKDIDINDKNRLKVIKWLKEYYDNYEKVNTLKGLYLHGSFGSGKTFLIAALLNELEVKKNAQIEIVYFPELLRNMKEDFSLVEDKLRYLQTVDILLLDDIGAESVTVWGRDEILGTILQYRMNNKLSTFFTSNLTIEELEKHLALTKNSEDKVKARRIVERIKQLTNDLELVSVNRRK